MITFAEILGWIGSTVYIIAYLLLSLKKVTADSPMYHLLNIVGAVGLIINAFHWKNYPSVLVNVAWFFIATVAISMILIKKYHRPSSTT